MLCILKTKSKVVTNRVKVKYIRQAKDKLEIKYKKDIKFRYLETKDNPEALLTRGLSSKKFMEY